MKVQICDDNARPLSQRPIEVMQYYLRIISRYYPSIPSVFDDGYFREDTTAAVLAFQKEFGLPVTGNIDLATWESILQVWQNLEALTMAPEEFNLAVPRGDIVLLTLGERDNQLTALLQTVLLNLSVIYGNLPAVAPTGVYDEQTSRAVQDFQRLAGLPVADEGWLDRRTWNTLLRFWETEAKNR